jgi:ribonuclease P/MRP protein subunit POP5
VKYFSPATSTAIVRVSRDHYRLVWAALTFSTQLPKPVFQQPCVFQVVKVSGTIRKAEEAAIRRAQLSIRRAQRESSSITKGLMPGLSSAKDGNVDDDLDAGFANGIEDLDDDEDEDDSG